MRMRWSDVGFLHWAYDPADVQRVLPRGLTVQTHQDRAWVGLVPLHMTVCPPVGPPVPWLSFFPEVNVRTYVVGPDGGTGICFFSLDAARLVPVLTARTTLSLPYCWADMEHQRDGDQVGYSLRRRWPRRGAQLRLQMTAGAPYAPDELTPFDHFLLSRFILWTRHVGQVLYQHADHPRWPVRRATVDVLDTDVMQSVGLPAPVGAPIVHFSDGVDVAVGRPHRAR